MKKLVLAILVLTSTMVGAQTIIQNAPRQISVSGEGEIKVTPDEAIITIGVTNMGADAKEVKNENDVIVDRVMKYLKRAKLPEEDYQTKNVYLNRSYQYDKKKYTYTASQTITIYLKDLSKYDDLIIGLTDAGINNIQGIQFKTSKQEQYESKARVKAIQDAQKKAKDYADALGMYIGYPLLVNDNTSNNYYPSPMYAKIEMESMSDAGSRETLAIGEITIKCNVAVTYEMNITDEKSRIDKMRKKED
ncbi:SIMPL domain-containing protein [Flavobacterium litorale]|uniref:SIMPL domain-containing protein n=1 Tax=Flavobacterium litorale TaxID=2856519 RepID=A0ABX8V8P9_9FLAO|nr:SIMPL domain-containing protein [Flavobacterium litorale]QYJ67588.1 SIMPL domain-containing protein [Flavobacterium litorale]